MSETRCSAAAKSKPPPQRQAVLFLICWGASGGEPDPPRRESEVRWMAASLSPLVVDWHVFGTTLGEREPVIYNFSFKPWSPRL